MTAGFSKANHHPVISVNGHENALELLKLELEPGSACKLDPSATYDPDGDSLSFRWFQYEGPRIEVWGAHKWAAKLEIKPLSPDNMVVEVLVPPADKCCVEFKTWRRLPREQVLHLIVEVKDDGSPSLTTYKRVLIQTINPKSSNRSSQ